MVYVPSERRINKPFSNYISGFGYVGEPCSRHEYVYSWRSKIPTRFKLVRYNRKVNDDKRYGVNMGPDLWTYSPLERDHDDALFSLFESDPTKYNSAKVIPLQTLGSKQQSEGSLLDKLKWRNDFTRQIIDSAGFNSTSNNDVRRSRTDFGHDFATVVSDWSCPQVERRDAKTGALKFRLGVYPGLVRQPAGRAEYWHDFTGPNIPPQVPFPYGKGRWSTGVASQTFWPTLANNRFVENRTFAEMNPRGHGAQIGETIVELLRGNFPTILKNLKAALSKQQSIFKTMGSDYLNYQFGWKPLVSDFQNAIAVLTAIDRMLFTESSRRSRRFDIFSERISLADPTTIHMDSNSTVDTHVTAGTSSRYLANIPRPSAGGNLDVYYSSDLNVSAKFSPIARPSLGANYFTEGATDIVKQLGVWYPSLGWDLLPFSWLVDWSIGLGKSIENANAFNSTTGFINIDYAYATIVTKAHLFHKVRLTADNSTDKYTFAGMNSSVRELSVFARSISKNREPATPFGFGVSYGSLTGYQFSILSALGLAWSR